MSRFSVAIDIGGTFTDCILEDREGDLQIFKSPSTPGEFEQGFVDVLEVAADALGMDVVQLLSETKRIVHGSTISTNALVERKVANVGFLCNAGHPDILTLREAVRKSVFDWRLSYPAPFVPRLRTAEVRGRISASGVEVTELREEDVVTAVETFQQLNVEAIGVCFLWSVLDGRHEVRAREIIHELWPGVPVTLSHELNPIAREYRRAISTVIDASLYPIVNSYISRIVGRLDALGYGGELLLANCVGGMMPPGELARRPIFSVMSGPTLAPVAAKSLTNGSDVIVVDMGGTTFDVSAIRDGEVIVSADSTIGGEMLGIPKIDVRSVGAGGGSIAWIDAGGLLRVGPHSAGANPGPACYAKGGEFPTVTDANVVLGVIDPDNFLGGKIRLDAHLARRAVQTIADGLNCTLDEAAYSIYTTSNNVMVGAIEDITVKEGINPRDSSVVSGGGATGAHICDIANELGIRNIMIPRFAAGLSAYGGLISDIHWEEQAAGFTSSNAFDYLKVTEILEALAVRGTEFLDRAGVPKNKQRLAFSYLGRYRYQSWEIEVPLQLGSGIDIQGMAPTFTERFHQMHNRIYSIMIPDDVVEFTTWIVRATGISETRSAQTVVVREGVSSEPVKRRSVYVRQQNARIECPVFDGDDLALSTRIEGPAIIEQPTTTILVTDGAVATIDEFGNFHIDLVSATQAL